MLTTIPPSAAAEPLPAAILADIVTGLAAASDLWRAAVCHDPDGRRPVRLLASQAYEVWVIGWTTGQHVTPHDHGRSEGALLVVEGALVEVLPQAGRAPVERGLEAGRVHPVPVGTVHDVVNRAPAPATSLHVYSPPLTSMTYYDPATLAPVGTEPAAPTRPLLAGSAGSYLLHPARRRSLP
ncbi:MAG TPA: cysteine dioxygenase family protein [Acidimicrobiales bacterium]|jgi:predicted metal-dependent enzyme (double-stranded beta helix superfamily)